MRNGAGANDGAGGYRGVDAPFGGRGMEKRIDTSQGWNEHLVVPPLSPLPPAASPGRVERVDGMRFEMVGSTPSGGRVLGEQPLGRGPLGDHPQNF